MNRKMTYAVGVLTLALCLSCAKRIPPPSPPEAHAVDLAAWVPEEMEVLVVFSSLEALKSSMEQLKTRPSLKPLSDMLEAAQKETQEELGLDLFSMSAWREMGVNTQVPVGLALDTREAFEAVLVMPVVEQVSFLAAVEKHLAGPGKWKAQPDMPEELRAWKARPGRFVVLAPKPGHALILAGEDLEVLKKRTQLLQEKSWARHKDILRQTDLRLPADRVVSVWARMDKDKDREGMGIEWVGAGVSTHPRAKGVVDVTWRQGNPLFPKTQKVPFEPGKWPRGLGDAAGGFWSAVPLDWYAELLQTPLFSRGTELGLVEMVFDVFKQNFEPPVLARAWIPDKEGGEGFGEGFEEDFHWSVDVLLKEGNSAEKSLNLLAAFISSVSRNAFTSREEARATQADSRLPIWEVQAGEQKLWAHVSGPGRVRIADRLHSYEREVPNVLQKEVMQEMTHYPIAAAFHLNALSKSPMFRFIFGGNAFEKAEYILLGLCVEEGHAQLVGEHFMEVDSR